MIGCDLEARRDPCQAGALVGLEHSGAPGTLQQGTVQTEEDVGDRPAAREDGPVERLTGVSTRDEHHFDPASRLEPLYQLRGQRERVVGHDTQLLPRCEGQRHQDHCCQHLA